MNALDNLDDLLIIPILILMIHKCFLYSEAKDINFTVKSVKTGLMHVTHFDLTFGERSRH